MRIDQVNAVLADIAAGESHRPWLLRVDGGLLPLLVVLLMAWMEFSG